MRKVFLIAILLFSSVSAHAQQSLSDQIGAVRDAQDQQDSAEREAQRAYQQGIARQQAAERVQAEQRQSAALALQQQKQAAAIALQQQKESEAAADKQRDQAYQDKLRELDVQQKQLEVEAEKARVARSNEYIDQELKEKAATTDVIKSQADSNRDLSEGTKALLEKTGDAEVKSQSGMFK